MFIDTLISAAIIATVMLTGVLASAIYEHIERSRNDRTRN